MQKDVWEEQRLLLEERRRTIVLSPTALHIDYYGPILTPKELKECEHVLREAGLQLSSFNKTGIVYAAFEDYSNLARVILHDELTKSIVYGVAGSLVWETIKEVTKRAWRSLAGAKTKRVSGPDIEDSKVTFGIDYRIDANTGIAFRLEGSLSEASLDKILDETRSLVGKMTPNAEYQRPLFARYDVKTKRWVILDPIEEVRRAHFAQMKPRKQAKASRKKGKRPGRKAR